MWRKHLTEPPNRTFISEPVVSSMYSIGGICSVQWETSHIHHNCEKQLNQVILSLYFFFFKYVELYTISMHHKIWRLINISFTSDMSLMSHTDVKVGSQQITNSYWQCTSLISTVCVLIITYHRNPQVRQSPYLPDMISCIYFLIPKLKQNLEWQAIWWGQNWTQYSRLMADKSKTFVQPIFPSPAWRVEWKFMYWSCLLWSFGITLPNPHQSQYLLISHHTSN